MLEGADTYEGNTRNAFWMSDRKMELEKPCRKVWKCTCECGGYCYVREDALIDGIVKNCGAECHIEVKCK